MGLCYRMGNVRALLFLFSMNLPEKFGVRYGMRGRKNVDTAFKTKAQNSQEQECGFAYTLWENTLQYNALCHKLIQVDININIR